MSAELHAQGNGFIHPHIAPKHATYTGQPNARSGFLDLEAASVWHRGDAIYPAPASAPPIHPGRAGGFKTFHDGSNLTIACVHDTTAPAFVGSTPLAFSHPAAGGWHQISLNGAPAQRFLGHLRPPASVAGAALPTHNGVPYVDDAGFELFAPTGSFATGDRVVFFLLSTGSVRSPRAFEKPSNDDRLLYPGRFSRDGLYRDENATGGPTQSDPSTAVRPWAIERLFASAELQRMRSLGIYPIVGHITHTFPNKQTTFEIQRLLELHRAVSLMLADPDPIYRPATVPVVPLGPGELVTVTSGGSNGGELSTWLPLFWPERFHASAAFVYPPSLRREIGEQAFWEMTMGMSGFAKSGLAYLLGDALQWNMFPVMRSVIGGASPQHFNFWDLSYLLRLQQGTMPRSAFFIPGDEDITTTGTDWAADVAGSWMQSGASTINLPTGTSATLSFSIVDNRCHEIGYFPHPVTGSPLYGTSTIGAETILPDIAAYHAIPAADHQRTTGLVPPPVPDAPVQPATSRSICADDVYDPIMAYSPALSGHPTSVPSGSGYLRLSTEPGWVGGKLPGAGTWLGRDDTMVIRGGSVFVGSADGVVSKYSPTGFQGAFELNAQSPVLGRWISGLTHGAFGGAERVICATYGHLFVLDTTTLAVVASTAVSFDAFWPRRINLADVDPTVAGNEIVCPTYNGGILVFRDGGAGQPPVERLHWPEPGVADLVESNGSLVLLSHRGVVASTRLFTGGGTTGVLNRPSGTWVSSSDHVADLFAASSPQNGVPLDLETLVDANDTAVLALYRDCAGADRSLRKFRSSDGAMLHSRWFIDPDPTPVGQPPDPNYLRSSGVAQAGYDIETTRHTPNPSDAGSDDDGAQGDHVVLLTNDTLYLLDTDLNFVGRRDIGGYLPAARAVDIAVGDLVPGPAVNNYEDEVVVATSGGRLVWIPVGALVGGSPQTPNPLSAWDVNYSLAGRSLTTGDFRANQSTSAWWGLVVDSNGVNGFDQQGTHWRVPVAGGMPTVVQEVPPVDIKAAARTPKVAVPVQVPLPIHSWGGQQSERYEVSPLNGVGRYLGVLYTWPPYPADPGRKFFGPVSLIHETELTNAIWDEYVAFRQPGVTWQGAIPGTTANIFAMHWWSGSRALRSGGGTVSDGSLIEGALGDYVPATSQLTNLRRIWASTNPAPSSWFERDFRSIDYGLSGLDLQSMLILDDDPNLLLLGTAGGELRVIDAQMTLSATSAGRETNAAIDTLPSSSDLGHGVPSMVQMVDAQTGITHILAVVSLDHQPQGNLTATSPQAMAGALHHFTWSGGALAQVGAKRRLDASMTLVPGAPPIVPVGVYCGDVLGSTDPEVVVTGMFGEVLVFGFSSYQLSSTPIQALRLEGSIGWHGAIRQDANKRLIIAGSQGCWKLEVTP